MDGFLFFEKERREVYPALAGGKSLHLYDVKAHPKWMGFFFLKRRDEKFIPP